MSRNLNKLFNYSLLKILLIPLVLWIISSLVFILLRVAPGDPVDVILGSGANEISREILRALKISLEISLAPDPSMTSTGSPGATRSKIKTNEEIIHKTNGINKIFNNE